MVKKPRNEPIGAGESEFRRWRHVMGWTQEQAAEALAVSVSHVKNWDAGEDRGRGTPSIPPLAVRMVMGALSRGETLEPWPAEPVKRPGERRKKSGQ